MVPRIPLIETIMVSKNIAYSQQRYSQEYRCVRRWLVASFRLTSVQMGNNG
jgi:hypothetical protein